MYSSSTVGTEGAVLFNGIHILVVRKRIFGTLQTKRLQYCRKPLFRAVHKTEFHCRCVMYWDRYVNAALLLAVLSAVAELPKMLSHLGVIPLLSDLSIRK